jgi:hypothetical protein
VGIIPTVVLKGKVFVKLQGKTDCLSHFVVIKFSMGIFTYCIESVNNLGDRNKYTPN